MFELWAPLSDIPAEGRVFSFSDPAIWESPWREFSLPYTMGKDLAADLTLIPSGQGFLIKGRLTGSILVPCDRCAESMETVIDHAFQEHEEFSRPQGDADADALMDDPSDSDLIRGRGEEAELNVAGLLWEQFQLALPQNMICADGCKGLCPVCGSNLNQGGCDCEVDEGDPRLAALRNLKIS
ncbi:MAG: DUF177 domain-containing protein [Desulfovibrio sp.]|nr:MAG: DUF177 domain-containing protein [Desulfovibrio sp.]